MNDGTRDIGNTQAPVLLFRGLDPLSGPQAIAQAMKSSSGIGKDGAKGMKRIILIKDKVTLASFGFTFVEFVDIQSASAVLAATMSPQIHPSGFRISDRPVAASFAHPYSFQLVADHVLRDEAVFSSSLNLGGVEGSWVKYWDETTTVAILEFEVEGPPQVALPMSTKEKKGKKKLKDDAITPAPNALPEASVLPISDKPVTLTFKGVAASKAATSTLVSAPSALGFSSEESGALSPGADEAQLNADAKAAAAKKVAPLIASKKTVNNINKWNQVQEELRDDSEAHPPDNPVGATSPLVAPSTAPAQPQRGEFEFSDTNAMTCLLCARQFKSTDQLKRHNKESDLHKNNLKDATLQELARQKAQVARKTTQSTKVMEQTKYRDRAFERRIMHNQPDVPPPDNDNIPKKRHIEGPPPITPPPVPVVSTQDDNNIGNKLLKMMGWKEGTGLGSSGEGRTEPIQTAIYAQGVGLGASKGKEIGKYADGYSGYVHMVQDAARERFGL
ncbi:hypothetical protein SERLADRAFT_474611 [Serpula lacrymans var. lacrymans S7.9]|nr:uncharacterized protein SERLADRAFT_474611 [Serpula lacrymans var. lacrymans S7.9]EGO21762.1 hypothetical protein SERLADRAFT_474611 [Serpula lacrymans var. lacrymans S7.9]